MQYEIIGQSLSDRGHISVTICVYPSDLFPTNFSIKRISCEILKSISDNMYIIGPHIMDLKTAQVTRIFRHIQGVSERMQQSKRVLDQEEVYLIKASWWQNFPEI